MSGHRFSDSQVDKARHALGVTREKTAYRNYYSCAADADWDDLVARGFAVRRRSPVSEDFLYHLTRQAAFFFLNAGERIGDDVDFPAAPQPREGAEKA